MNDLLVGSTGFVGGNLMAAHDFEAVCHSSDVRNHYGSAPGLCIYAGVTGAMFLANHAPEKDLAIVMAARENIRRIAPDCLVLISTIAVYDDTHGKNEESSIDESRVCDYGRHRLMLERWIREDRPDALIVRIPALYGKGLKKNFLFDLHSMTPPMLTPSKFEELCGQCSLVKDAYYFKDDGFYHIKANTPDLRSFFEHNSFNALSFTDSRSIYQFYNLSNLWNDICVALENGLKVLNICTPPVSAGQVYEYVTGRGDWNNTLPGKPFDYDLKSLHAPLYGGTDGYMWSVEKELEDIKNFMSSWKSF